MKTDFLFEVWFFSWDKRTSDIGKKIRSMHGMQAWLIFLEILRLEFFCVEYSSHSSGMFRISAHSSQLWQPYPVKSLHINSGYQLAVVKLTEPRPGVTDELNSRHVAKVAIDGAGRGFNWLMYKNKVVKISKRKTLFVISSKPSFVFIKSFQRYGRQF